MYGHKTNKNQSNVAYLYHIAIEQSAANENLEDNNGVVNGTKKRMANSKDS